MLKLCAYISVQGPQRGDPKVSPLPSNPNPRSNHGSSVTNHRAHIWTHKHRTGTISARRDRHYAAARSARIYLDTPLCWRCSVTPYFMPITSEFRVFGPGAGRFCNGRSPLLSREGVQRISWYRTFSFCCALFAWPVDRDA